MGGRRRIGKVGCFHPCERQAGLTLIEVLVVMAILALAASVVVLNAPPSRPPARMAAENFAAEVRAAFSAALIEGAPYRLEIGQTEYAVARFAGAEWRRASRTAAGSLSSDIQFTVEITDPAAANALALNGEMDDATNQNDKTLLIPLDPLGGGPSATARFESRRGNWVVQIAPNGAVSMQEQ